MVEGSTLPEPPVGRALLSTKNKPLVRESGVRVQTVHRSPEKEEAKQYSGTSGESPEEKPTHPYARFDPR